MRPPVPGRDLFKDFPCLKPSPGDKRDYAETVNARIDKNGSCGRETPVLPGTFLASDPVVTSIIGLWMGPAAGRYGDEPCGQRTCKAIRSQSRRIGISA